MRVSGLVCGWKSLWTLFMSTFGPMFDLFCVNLGVNVGVQFGIGFDGFWRISREPTFDMEREARFHFFTFLPVSSRFFRVLSRFSPPLRAERAGRRDDFDVSPRLFSFFRVRGNKNTHTHTHTHTYNNNHSNHSGLSTTEMYDVKYVIAICHHYYYY